MANKHDKNIKITVTDNGTLKQTTKDINKLNKAQQKNNKASQGLDRNMKGNARMSSNASKNFSKQAQGMQGVLVPAYAEVAARVFALTAAFTALERAANYRILLEGQTLYAKLTGKNMGSIAKKIQQATGFMIDFKEASTAAALGVTSGLTSKTMVRMAEVARAASVALGRDLSDSMDRLTRGIVKAEPEILDEIGIIIRLDTVYKKYAETLDTTTARLTEYEKLQARVNAILGQGETKFGDIAKAIDPNGWSQVSAAVLDMVNSFAGFVSGPIEGVMRFLSQAKLLLGLLLALIAKSLVGKLSGAFKGFNSQIAAIPKKLEGVSKRIAKWQSNLGAKRAGYADRLVPYKDAESAIKKTLEGEGVNLKKTGALYTAAVTKGLTGPAFIKAVNKSLGVILGSAKASMVDGVVTRGALKGDDGRLIQTLEKQQKTLQKGITESSKGMKGLMGIQFLDWMTNAIASTAQLGSKVTLSGLSFLNYAKQIGKTTQNVGLFSKTVETSKGIMEKQQGAIGLVLSTMKADFDKVWGKDAFSKLGASIGTWAKSVTSQFAGLNTRLSAILGGIGGAMFRMLNGISRQSSLFASKMPAPLLKAYNTTKKVSLGIIKTLAITAKAISGFAVGAISYLVNGLQLLSFAIGAISMFSYVGRMFLDWGKFMGKATEAASSLSSELEEINTRLTESININMEGIAGSMTGAIKSAEFISSVTNDLSESLSKALQAIDMKAVMTDSWGKFADFFYDMFGKGLEDDLGKALGNAMNSQARLGNKISKGIINSIVEGLDTKKDTDFETTALGGYLAKLSRGVALSSVELHELNDALEYVGKGRIIANLELISRKLEEQAKLSALAAGNLKGLNEGFDTLDKSIKTLLKGAVPDTPFSKIAEEYEDLKVLLGKDDISGSNKILAIFEKGRFSQAGVSDIVKKEYEQKIAALNDYKKKLSGLKLGEGSNAEISAAENAIKVLEASLGHLGNTISSNLIFLNKLDGIEDLMPKLFGGDMSKLNEDALKLATSIEAIERHSSKLSSADSSVFVAEIASDKSAVIGKNIKAIQTLLDINIKTPTLTDVEVGNLTDQIKGLTAEQFLLLRVKDKVAQARHKESGTIYTLSERLRNLKFDLALNNLEWDKLKKSKIGAAWTSIRKAISPLEDEAQNLSAALDVINTNFTSGSDKAKEAIETYTKLNTTLGKLQTTLNSDVFKEKQDFSKADTDLSVASSNNETGSVANNLKVFEATLARSRDAKRESLVAIGHTEEFAKAATDAMLTAHQKITKEAEKRLKLERKTNKVIDIKTRRKAISEELVNLRIQASNFKETSSLLGLRQETARIEREYAKEGLDIRKKALKEDEFSLAYARLQFDLFEAKREGAVKSLEAVATAYLDVATTISSGIGEAISSLFMGKESDQDWQTIISQTLADSAGGLVGNLVNEQLTGREGMAAGLFSDGALKDAIFGAEPESIQLGKDMTSLLALAKSEGLRVRIVESGSMFNTSVSTGTGTGTGTGTDKGWWESIKDFFSNMSVPIMPNVGVNLDLIKDIKAIVPVVSEDVKKWMGSDKDSDKIEGAVGKGNGILDWLKGYFKKHESPYSIATYDEQSQKLLGRIADALGSKPNLENSTQVASTDKYLNERIWQNMRKNIKSGNQLGNSTSQKAINNAVKQGINERHAMREAIKEFKSGESKFRIKPSHSTGSDLNRFNRTIPGIQHPESAQKAANWKTINDFNTNRAVGPQRALPFKGEGIPTNSAVSSTLLPTLTKISTFLGGLLYPNNNIMDTKTEMESLSDLPKGMSGALKVQEVDPKVLGGNGIPIPTTSITGDATTNKLSADLRGSMASNLQSQIMNDNLNAKALITNSLSTVGSNLMGSAINSMFGFANGGVATGGFRAFANGGTVTKPTLGLVGEGRYNEAVVPLPDGKSIPVIGAGGNSGDNNITVNVTVDSNGNAKSDTQSGMDGDQAKQLGYMISQAVQAELVEQQRHGGLLSSY